MAEKNETGKTGEAVARSYLEISGYTVLDTNWRFHHYELDIIATNGQELVVVEVKTRSSEYLISPEDAINTRKIKRIVAAADAYARMKQINLPVRFDIICLIKDKQSYTVEKHYEDAFYAPIK
jgi:putative endonuclease